MRPKLRSVNLAAAVVLAAGFGSIMATSAMAQGMVVEGEKALEEVTVTARKREEALQDVALSVSAMGQEEIELNFATDIRDLIYISPNTVLDDTNQGPGGVAAAYIRGIGVSEVEKNFDPAVGVVVDGLFLGTMSGGIARSIDLARMEILRGPQGTLFGRNTIGGVINMERSRPTMETGGKLRGGVGNYDTNLVDGIVNFGNGDTWGVKLSGAWRDQGEGYLDNVHTGRDEGRLEYKSVGVNVLWAPTDALELEFTYNADRYDQDSPPLLNAGQPGQVFCDGFGVCAPSLTVPTSGDRYLSDRDCGPTATPAIPGDEPPWVAPGYDAPSDCNDASFDADTLQLEVRWDLNDDYRIDYIGGTWETDEAVVNDWDAVQQVMFHTNRPAEYEQTTHELRMTYDAGGSLAYTVGLYFWDSEYYQILNSYIGFVLPNIVFDLPQFTVQTSESRALFFEGDYSFNDSWTLTLGGRWTEDDKTTDQTGVNIGSAEEDWSEFTPKVALKWDFSEDAMIYALYSRGYRAGGFNGRVDSTETAETPYDPETVDNYEIGYRSEWANRTVIFNATAFYMDYKDKQEEIHQPSATSGTGQVTRVVNASSATIKGVELELMWIATDRLSFRTNLGYLDAGYDDFTVNIGTSDDPVLRDYSYLDFRRAPEITASVAADYAWDLGNSSRMLIRGGIRYLDGHAVDFLNKPELNNSSQTLVDGSINYYYKDWSFSLWGRNLTDEDGYQIGFDVANLWSYAAPRTPRTYGFEVGYSF